jgi:hypothetical protein
MFVNAIVNLNVNMWLYMKYVYIYIYMKSVFFCKCQKFTKIEVFLPLLNNLMSDGLIKPSDIVILHLTT